MTEVLTQPSLAVLAERLGHDFATPGLLELALRHRSWCAENPGHESNERLEFLGDAVLGLAVATHLYETYGELAEGQLHRSRAAVVSSAALAHVAIDLELGAALFLGRGEEQTGGREKTSVLEDALEAVFGAVYLDGGYGSASRVILRCLGPHLDAAVAGPGDEDYKSRLLERTARSQKPLVITHDVEGPEHAPTFEATVCFDDEVIGVGSGRSKKVAEQEAARVALQALGVSSSRKHESESDA